MHTLEYYGGRIFVSFRSEHTHVRLFRFELNRINIAMELVNFLNGGAGEAFHQEINPEEVYFVPSN